MDLIKISDPQKQNTDKNTKKELAIGIDFGTTNSLISVFLEDKIHTISDSLGNELIKSVVSWKNGQFIVGGSESLHAEPNIYSIKRLLGKSKADLTEDNIFCDIDLDSIGNDGKNIFFKLGEKNIYAYEIASKIFIYLKKMLDNYLYKNHKEYLGANKVVVTVPAYFDDGARGQIILAARLAGLDLLRLIAEPTAAAYAYGVSTEKPGSYLVYDLGGGTFDISIIEVDQGIIQVVEVAGNNMFGGDDIDKILTQEIFNNVSRETLLLAKSIKEKFNNHKIVEFFDPFLMKKRSITIEDFNKIIEPLIQKTIDQSIQAHKRAGSPELSAILLVGGSTRINLIAELISKNFNVEILQGIDKDKIVSSGACLQAKNLISQNSDILVDVNALSIGLELYGGINEKIIERSSPIPITVKREFTTQKNNQTGMQFHITQGEREMASDCRSLARFELKNLPAAKAGDVKVEITFALDSNNILSIYAIEKNTGISQDIVINPSFGISGSEVEKIIEDSYKNAKSDYDAKRLQEAINLGEEMANNLLAALIKIENLKIDQNDKNQIASIRKEANNLLSCLLNSDYKIIEEQIENLQNNSSEFIMSKLNLALEKTYKGKNINQIIE